MKTKLFSAYTNTISRALSDPGILHRNISKAVNENLSDFTGVRRKSIALSAQVDGIEETIGIKPLKDLLGITRNVVPTYGDHPDFGNIRFTGNSEQHYIVSCFIDVRKSTNLFKEYKNYNHDQIAAVIQTIQSAAIHTCSLFNGHIQRLQYDGLFVYFGGKGQTKAEAIRNAMNASSFFTYFIKYELQDVFNDNGMEEINTRVGIDFGDDSDVSWYVFGVGECSELTTLSLHTSLAPKMQGNAMPNGMVIGENMVNQLPALRPYASIIKDKEGKENRYIFTQPNYTQLAFDWESYLVDNFSFVRREGSGIAIDYGRETTVGILGSLNEINDRELFNIASRSKPFSNG